MINGRKMFIGLAERVEFLILFASTDPSQGSRGVTAFLIESGTPGYNIARLIQTMGDAWVPTELEFDNCRVPAPSASAKRAKPSAWPTSSSVHGRLKIATYQLGIAQRCLDDAVA